ncbi:MAG: hypothetical protein Q4P13_05930 [Psychrobacter sp.]|nr:hypothetical protein [Psychrobacter sp.]
MINSLPTLQTYKRQYATTKTLGAAMLACNALLVPEGFENLYVLITNFQRPIVSNNDSADVDFAGGLQAHVAGVPKTNFESQWTMIETEKGVISSFAEQIVNKYGGILPSAKVHDGHVNDGGVVKGVRTYDLEDLAITFADGGGEIDSSSRSQILQVQASCRYMYFGQSGGLGIKGTDDLFTTILTNALNAFGGLTAMPNAGSQDVTIYG